MYKFSKLTHDATHTQRSRELSLDDAISRRLGLTRGDGYGHEERRADEDDVLVTVARDHGYKEERDARAIDTELVGRADLRVSPQLVAPPARAVASLPCAVFDGVSRRHMTLCVAAT